MSARKKLNSIYVGFAVIVASFIGLMTQSSMVFIVSLAILAGLFLHSETIRPQPLKKR